MLYLYAPFESIREVSSVYTCLSNEALLEKEPYRESSRLCMPALELTYYWSPTGTQVDIDIQE